MPDEDKKESIEIAKAMSNLSHEGAEKGANATAEIFKSDTFKSLDAHDQGVVFSSIIIKFETYLIAQWAKVKEGSGDKRTKTKT